MSAPVCPRCGNQLAADGHCATCLPPGDSPAGPGSAVEVLRFSNPEEQKVFEETRALLLHTARPEPPKEWRLIWKLARSRHRLAGRAFFRALKSRRVVWLGLTVLAFALLLAGAFPPLDLAILLGVLLFHEAGHYLGMVLFGYRDVRMFFIPLFGAAVAGERQGAPPWQEATVLLLGPVPGLVLGCALYFWHQAFPSPAVHQAARWLVGLNLLNLLPLEPLDGGKLFDLLLLSRGRNLQTVGRVAMALGLALLCWPSSACLALTAGSLLLLAALGERHTAAVAAAVRDRWPSLPPRLQDLSEEQLRDIFLLLRSSSGRGALLKPRAYATQMKSVYQQAQRPPVSPRVTGAFLAVYGGAIILFLIAFYGTGLGDDANRSLLGLLNFMRLPGGSRAR